MEKRKIFPLTQESLKVLVIVLAVISFLLACSTGYLLLHPTLTGNSSEVDKSTSTLKALCNGGNSSIFCKMAERMGFEPMV